MPPSLLTTLRRDLKPENFLFKDHSDDSEMKVGVPSATAMSFVPLDDRSRKIGYKTFEIFISSWFDRIDVRFRAFQLRRNSYTRSTV